MAPVPLAPRRSDHTAGPGLDHASVVSALRSLDSFIDITEDDLTEDDLTELVRILRDPRPSA